MCWGQRGGLCATPELRGAYGLKDTPRPHTSQSKTTWRVLSPDPENRGYQKTQPSLLLGLRGGAPWRVVPSWETGLHGPGNSSLC